jgi:hypothetical protein
VPTAATAHPAGLHLIEIGAKWRPVCTIFVQYAAGARKKYAENPLLAI